MQTGNRQKMRQIAVAQRIQRLFLNRATIPCHDRRSKGADLTIQIALHPHRKRMPCLRPEQPVAGRRKNQSGVTGVAHGPDALKPSMPLEIKPVRFGRPR